ncbi:hypothetical protein GCM10027447_30110 [Glycomyces halotolerans]
MRTTGFRPLAIAVLAAWLAGCSAIAASSGSTVDRIVAEAHTQVQTAGLVAAAGLEDPAPTVPLATIADDTEAAFNALRDKTLELPDDEPARDDLLDLTDASLALVADIRSALRADDRQALRELRTRATSLAEDWSLRSDLL